MNMDMDIEINIDMDMEKAEVGIANFFESANRYSANFFLSLLNANLLILQEWRSATC